MRMRAIVLAAGQGTRMKSALPKVLHTVAGRAMVSHVVSAAAGAGCDDVYVVVGHERQRVMETLRDDMPGTSLRFCVQHEQLGTADAVRTASEAYEADGLVLIVNGDMPNLPVRVIEDTVSLHRKRGAVMTVVTAQAGEDHSYGRIVRGEDGAVSAIVEHHDATPAQRAIREVNMGVYLCSADFLRKALRAVACDNAQGEFYLTDLVRLAHEGDELVEAFVAPDIAPLHGVNSRRELARAERYAQAQLVAYWQNEGVTFEEPASTRVECGVVLHRDVILEGGVSLRGATEVGEGARIEQGVRLEDTHVGERSRVRAHTVCTRSVIGEDCSVGPSAQLRPGTQLGRKVKIGNFVETKNATFSDGAKASHLSYVGDAEVGSGANIGAGTITCNYDGVRKHRTVIGADVFIGSDTQLVAPVALGDGSFIGAGSTITEDVPADALALTRTGQTIVEGWAARRRERDPTD